MGKDEERAEKAKENRDPVSGGGKEVPLTRPSDKGEVDVSLVFDEDKKD